MKKIILFAIFACVSVSSFGQGYREVLDKESNMSIIPIGALGAFPYKDNETNKYGFIKITNTVSVILEPQFDELFIGDMNKYGNMVLVEKDGKWGAVSCMQPNMIKKEPAVPCIYPDINVAKQKALEYSKYKDNIIYGTPD